MASWSRRADRRAAPRPPGASWNPRNGSGTRKSLARSRGLIDPDSVFEQAGEQLVGACGGAQRPDFTVAKSINASEPNIRSMTLSGSV